MTADERDKQVAHLIREEIAKTEHHKDGLRYPEGSASAALIDGKITGLRAALAFIDPQPWR